MHEELIPTFISSSSSFSPPPDANSSSGWGWNDAGVGVGGVFVENVFADGATGNFGAWVVFVVVLEGFDAASAVGDDNAIPGD